ncbi:MULTISPECIES: acetylglutamate kinase [Bacillus]|uniref:Acetylglutamate kinase n=1 Tax=Bacillus glycinifermentans TaxID=1664069 RepID=A0AAJ3YX74_9BACI|nr:MULTISPECIES: acetylglutamate kinase [Bacillus]KKB73372.1 acetylglutamate kinase [Bacillus sp. TH008]MDU0069580.1 acetylglutamate kinase [Bacillus sp. IG6]MED8017441.1 acetylglutamate kinase [Bacillus glycinifermentans]QAT64591.1 acetylglutamate kinase [Bacillus glycinifermentans]WKB78542.1 acetylglutamate kinase [Bacillus glycinifermentans]
MNKTIVFKCGGSVIRELSDEFFRNVKKLVEEGWKIAVVHGGGPEITNMLKKLKIETEFVNGQRKTTKQVLEIAEMVLSGSINKFFVSELARHGLPAVGVSGKDGGLLLADYINEKEYGQVGCIKKVNGRIVEALMEKGFIPVIAPLSMTENCETLNVNADLAASAVAGALRADKLMFVTDVKGIMKDGSMLSSVTPEEVERFIAVGVISGGMIPKVNSAVAALTDAVDEVMIVSGKGSFLAKDAFVGTKIIKEKEAV